MTPASRTSRPSSARCTRAAMRPGWNRSSCSQGLRRPVSRSTTRPPTRERCVTVTPQCASPWTPKPAATAITRTGIQRLSTQSEVEQAQSGHRVATGERSEPMAAADAPPAPCALGDGRATVCACAGSHSTRTTAASTACIAVAASTAMWQCRPCPPPVPRTEAACAIGAEAGGGDRRSEAEGFGIGAFSGRRIGATDGLRQT